MSNQKIIVVLGASGSQGGAVIDQLLKENKWKIRGICRHAGDEKAQRMKGRGVEIMECDMNMDQRWSEAFKGAYAVFALTDYWKPENAGKEYEQGKRIADKAEDAKVTHFIWSTMPNINKESNGKYDVPLFSDKAKVEEYVKTQKNFKYTTFIGPSIFYEDFGTLLKPREEKGVWIWDFPLSTNGYITAFDVNDIGKGVSLVLKNPDDWDKKFLPLAAEHMHPQDFIQQFQEVTGLKAKYEPCSRDQFAKKNISCAKELADMFGWMEEYTFFGKRDFTISKKMVPDMKSWRDWLKSSGFRPSNQ